MKKSWNRLLAALLVLALMQLAVCAPAEEAAGEPYDGGIYDCRRNFSNRATTRVAS